MLLLGLVGDNMQDYIEWVQKYKLKTEVDREKFLSTCLEYFKENEINEAVETSRYSVEVNYRTNIDEAMDGFAKLTLGYISSALKRHGFHTKHVFTEKPLRLLVSTRNWDDATWCGCVTWNTEHNCFMISKGFYNKERKTVSIQKTEKANGTSASEVSKELHNLMFQLKGEPDKHKEKLKPVKLQTGPKI